MKRFLTFFILNLDRLGLKFICIFSILAYVITYLGMKVFEPSMTESFFWYFVVTVTTVGYGDISPSTFGGKSIGVIVMVFGGLLYTMLIAYLYTYFSRIINKNKKGFMKYDLDNHIVIIGYNQGKTAEIIEEIRATKHQITRDIVLCNINNPDLVENPIQEHTGKFIQGNFSSLKHIQDTIESASMNKAHCIILDLEDDKSSFLVFADLLKDIGSTYIVVGLNDRAHNGFRFKKLSDNVCCVNSQEHGQIVSAFQHPGTVDFLDDLAHNSKGEKIMRLNLSAKANIKYIDLYIRLKQELNIQLSGIAESNKPSAITKQNPDNDLLLTNKGIFYTGDHTITEEDVLNLFPEINKWSNFKLERGRWKSTSFFS